MTPNLQNHQGRVAEQFRQTENFIIQESRVALLKIQSLQFALKTPEVGIHYQREAEEMIKQSLMTFVPNSFVLSESGFYFCPVEN
jgi:hypothetical protein